MQYFSSSTVFEGLTCVCACVYVKILVKFLADIEFLDSQVKKQNEKKSMAAYMVFKFLEVKLRIWLCSSRTAVVFVLCSS